MKLISAIIYFTLLSGFVSAQSFFSPVTERNIDQTLKTERSINPLDYRVFRLSFEEINPYLRTAPQENTFRSKKNTIPLTIPGPDGKNTTFNIYETAYMESELAARYKNIKTYQGYNQRDKSERIVVGISKKGFFATVKSPKGSYSIDRYADHQTEYYQVYFHDNAGVEEGAILSCGTESASTLESIPQSTFRSDQETLPLRVYKVAIAATGEFSKKFGPGKEEVLAELVKSVTRINQILEIDLAVRLVLVNNNDKVIFLDPANDPFSNGNEGGVLLGQATNVLNINLGFANYDVGHVYTAGCSDVGGIAFLRSVCGANKGAGVTCHSSNDITRVAVQIAAHEFGHQFGANHTFNNCNGNENSGTAYEPGSGSTIMSYGGLCGANLNVVSINDDYFHVRSIMEINDFTRNSLGNNCPDFIETSNHLPEVSTKYFDGFHIPISTPFELTGISHDKDGDFLTYNWEQFDLGPSVTLGAAEANSPLFRSVYPSSSPTRVFPRIETIISNGFDKTEVLPNYERALTFQFVARDNNPEAGGVAWTKLAFRTTNSAGPFLVLYPNSVDTFNVGQEIEVLWDVSNTNNDIVNCQAVDILLSIDGGLSYDITLAESTENDGNEKVFIPNKTTDQARIKVKATDNVFFDISNQDFSIQEALFPGFIVDINPRYIESCVPEEISLNIDTEGLLGYDQIINLEIQNELPEGMLISFEESQIAPGISTNATISFENEMISGIYELFFLATTESDTLYRSLILDLKNSNFDDVHPLSPLPGSSGNDIAGNFSWSADADAEIYFFKISDNPSFNPEAGDFYFEASTTDTFISVDDILQKSTLYYWTIEAANACGFSEFNILNTFATEALSCNTYKYNDLPVGITQSAVITIEMPLQVFGDGLVTDVNIKKLRGAHSWISELKGEIVSPSGTSVLLFNNKCGNQSDFNCGFDDDAGTDITCPLNQGIFYRPQELLAVFNGEPLAGTWIMKLTDTKIGNGGSVQEYQLELCSNAVLESPFLVNNKPFPLPSGIGRRITSEFLFTDDDNNTNDELLYTIINIPTHGMLRNEEDTLGIGSQFSQKDIDEMKIRYQHFGNSTVDSFDFVVEDGEGGWIDVTTFNIIIDNDIVLDVNEISANEINIFPNPNNGTFYLKWTDEINLKSIEIFNIGGQLIQNIRVPNTREIEIQMPQQVPGIYFIALRGDNHVNVKKFIIN